LTDMAGTFPEYLSSYLPEERINKDNLQYFKYKGRGFYRLRKEAGKYPRGTVFWEEGLLLGYQRIKRIIMLSEGIRRNLSVPFFVEEKMEGYNVRLRQINGTVYAFTRGGFVCPFTMDRLRDFIPIEFFQRYPDYTLCIEVVGPENPYNSEEIPYMDEDIDFFAFDLKDSSGKSLRPQQRYRILEDVGIKSVRYWGPFSPAEVDSVRRIIEELDREGREGVVMKSVDGEIELKYVTLSSCIRDLEATGHLMTELQGGFYIQRILRIAAILTEFGIEPDERLKLALADAMLLPIMETMKEVLKGGSIMEKFSIRVNSEETVRLIMEHLKKTGTKAEISSVERSEDRWKVSFYKIFQKGTKVLRKGLTGHGFYD